MRGSGEEAPGKRFGTGGGSVHRAVAARPPAPGTSLSKLSGADAIRLQIGHASAG